MHRGFLTLMLVVLTGTLGHAGQQPQPTFRATTRLIVQPVTVKDKKGKPVEGLTAKDFLVSEDGQPQQIAFVEYQPLETTDANGVATIAAPTTIVPVTQEGVSVPLPGDVRYRGRRLLVLYFDLYQMAFFDRMRAFTSADRYITTRMTPADMIAIMVFQGSGVRLQQDFTGDRATLRQSIDVLMNEAEESNGGINIASGGAFGENDDVFNVFATDRQLSALQTAVTNLAPLPQQKTLVYLGSGLRLNGADNQAQLRATINAAVRANVTLNPIDARGLVATAPLGDATRPSPGGIGMFSGTLAQAATTRFQQAQDTLYALAKDTGGRAVFDNNDLTLGIAQVAQAVIGYYLIGYYSTHAVGDGRFRRVKVTLASSLSADVSYRAGYYADKPYTRFTRADKERQLLDALRLDEPVTDIPMVAQVNYFQSNRAEYFVPVSVRLPRGELTREQPPGASHIALDMIGEIKDEHGVTYRNVRDKIDIIETPGAQQPARPWIQYETGFTVLPGTYAIKLLVRNEDTGRIGTLQSSFTIPNLEREDTRLPISSVVLSNERMRPSDALGIVKQKLSADAANPLVHDGQKLIPSVTRTFSARRPLFVFLQAYERDAPTQRPLVAFVTFFRDGTKVVETDLQAVSDAWDQRAKAVPIRFSIPMDGMAPGSYECQVTVLDPDDRRAAFWRASIVVGR